MCAFRFDVWPTEYLQINQYFGANPQNYAQFGLPGHEGVDIRAPSGSEVYAVAPGDVFEIRTNPVGHNYGRYVRIRHSDGYSTTYAHLEEVRVQVGDRVAAGAVVGLANDSGNSFGAHLHLTLQKEGAQYLNYPSNIVDPTPFLLPLMGWIEPAGPYTEGWGYTIGLFIIGNLGQVNSGGINLRARATAFSDAIGFVPGGTIVIVTGEARGRYVPIKVANASIAAGQPPPPPPEPPPPPTATTVDGWGWRNYLTISGNQATVGQFGINLRMAPNTQASNIGVVRGGSTVTVLGEASGDYLPVRARREDFLGPVTLPAPPPDLPPGGEIRAGPDSWLGWVWTPYLTEIGDNRGIIGQFGSNMRARPSVSAPRVGLVKGSATVTIVGLNRGEYTPVLASRGDVLQPADPMPVIEIPDPLPGGEPPPPPPGPPPPAATTPGFAFTAQVTVDGSTAVAGRYGINLRQAPRRDGANIGFVPANASMLVTGDAQGEYTPVRIANDVLQPPFGSGDGTVTPPDPPDPPDPPVLGSARLGLHASADPDIKEAEFAEFREARPGMIKVLSMHGGGDIARLAAEHPDASFVVRAFLSFGGRNISPHQFLNDTISDVRRSLNALPGRDVVVELHNEPNLVPEGLGSSWNNGSDFNQWWLSLLALYRQALPNVRFLYPGLSPGPSVANIKLDHIQFIEASRAAVEAADGLAVHLYWSNVYPMSESLRVLDDYISRFRFKKLWVTEASNNKSGTSPQTKAHQYLQFWQELQQRPVVQGVTYFVASASNPAFAEEVWVGRGIGQIVGRR